MHVACFGNLQIYIKSTHIHYIHTHVCNIHMYLKAWKDGEEVLQKIKWLYVHGGLIYKWAYTISPRQQSYEENKLKINKPTNPSSPPMKNSWSLGPIINHQLIQQFRSCLLFARSKNFGIMPDQDTTQKILLLQKPCEQGLRYKNPPNKISKLICFLKSK